MVKPGRTLGLLAIVFALTLGMMAVFPKEGVVLREGLTLHFPDIVSFFEEDRTERRVALEELFDIYALKVDSTAIKDSIQARKIRRQQEMKKLQFPGGDASVMEQFARALQGAQNGPVRVLHYGDSQIEGDRISAYIRQRLQQSYGGSGYGWISLTEAVPNMSVDFSFSENWERFTIYGRAQSKVHNRYGILGAFSRFTPENDTIDGGMQVEDSSQVAEIIPSSEDEIQKERKKKKKLEASIVPALDTLRAWVEISPSRRAYNQVRQFDVLRLAYGNAQHPTQFKLYLDEELYQSGVLPPKEMYHELRWQLEGSPGKIRFEFSGIDSPDFYGLSMESSRGVIYDNIGMRGSSGTIFNKMDSRIPSAQSKNETVGLVILQYGGNSVPYIDSEKKAEDFGRWFQAQIKFLKRIYPSASFVLIGPSDMSTKEKDKFVTFPYLEAVRDALQEAAFSQGAAYWDMYEAMGGKGSMPSWVNADPPLASTDHIHFAPGGARLVAEWFFDALMEGLQKTKEQ